MNEAKEFPTLAVLSVTSGRLLTRNDENGNGIGQMYELLGWMTDDEPFTHQLGRFAKECKPHLDSLLPTLSDATDEICRRCDGGDVAALQDELEERFGKTVEVTKLAAGKHATQNPIGELLDMMGN